MPDYVNFFLNALCKPTIFTSTCNLAIDTSRPTSRGGTVVVAFPRPGPHGMKTPILPYPYGTALLTLENFATGKTGVRAPLIMLW